MYIFLGNLMFGPFVGSGWDHTYGEDEKLYSFSCEGVSLCTDCSSAHTIITKHRVTIPCKWSFDFTWNPADFTWIHPKPYKSKCFNQNYSVWWMQERGYDPGFHDFHEISWNPLDFTWNPPDFMNVSFWVITKYRSFFRKTKHKDLLLYKGRHAQVKVKLPCDFPVFPIFSLRFLSTKITHFNFVNGLHHPIIAFLSSHSLHIKFDTSN